MAKDMKERILARAPAVFACTAPISVVIHLCDREAEKAGEAMEQAEAFIRHFINVYGRKEHVDH